MEFSTNDELMEDPQEDPELGEHQPDHDVEDVEPGTSDSSLTPVKSIRMSLSLTTIHLGIARLI